MKSSRVGVSRATVRVALIAALAASSCSGGSSQAPTAPTPTPPPTAAPPPPATTVSLAGRVLSTSGGGFPVRAATVTAIDGVNSGRSVTTDSAGAYRFESLQRTNTNFSASAPGCREDRRGIFVDGASSLDFTLQCDTVPVLLSPANGEIMDNGCITAFPDNDLERQIWNFDWSDVPGATVYHLYVKNPRATFPVIDNPNITASEFERRSTGYVIEANARGWEWRVRARIGDTFGDWSATRTFDVEPAVTDCPPTITSVSPSDLTTGRHTITLNGRYLIPGTLAVTSPNGRTSTYSAPQVFISGRYVIQSDVTFGDPGTWTLRLTTVRGDQSNAFTVTVR